MADFGLSCDRSGLSCDRFGLSCERSRLSCDRFGLSCDTFGLSCDRFGLSCDSFRVKLSNGDDNIVVEATDLEPTVGGAIHRVASWITSFSTAVGTLRWRFQWSSHMYNQRKMI